MTIAGLQKTTLLDYPGKLACTIFLSGCNFRCPFCHNSSVVYGNTKSISYDEIMTFLKKRSGILDAVCITGGEPLMNREIVSFIKDIHELGYSIKIDTNGSYPERLQYLIDEHLIDYAAMDIKNSPEKYSLTAGTDVDMNLIEQSINILKRGDIPYEFRTTVVRELHNEEDIHKIVQFIPGCQKYYLQQFVDSGELIGTGMSAYSREELLDLLVIAKKYVPVTTLRGI